jgi:8-oxo-dGTP pyrophosphatase MutT (NUDIX family)
MTPSRLERVLRYVAAQVPRRVHDPALAEAAVALVCARAPESILLIRRAEREGDPWSGQMGLPGGRRGTADPDLLATAIRETREEIGLELSPDYLVGELDDHAPRTPLLPPIVVRPFVFLLEFPRPLRLNGEVAAADWIPLEAFFGPGVYAEYEVEARGLPFRRPGYQLGVGLVWGMTERILTRLFTAAEPGAGGTG